MKKKFLALVCLTAVVFALLFPPASGAKYDGVYCVAVNETILRDMLTLESMPFSNGGQMYVPYAVFASDPLGLILLPNRANDTFLVYSNEKTLIFNISGGTCADGTGEVHNARALSRDGRIFLPIRFVCTFFGLTYSYLNAQLSDGVVPILRISDRSRELSDYQFASAASDVIANPVAAYLRSLPDTPTPVTSPPPTPSVTPPSPPSPPPPTPTVGAPDHSDIQVFLAFEMTGDTAGLTGLLSTLAARRLSALFLFRPDELAERGGEVRQVLGRGHAIGLLLPDDDTRAGYETGARLLAHIARVDTRIVAASNDAEPDEAWAVWRGNIDGRTGTGGAAARADGILTAAAARRSPVRITLGCDAADAATADYLLRGLLEARFDLRPVTEASLRPAL